MAQNGLNFDGVWAAIKDTVVKSLLAVQPGLAHHYRAILPQGHGTTSCFELLGAHSFTSLLYGLRTVVCVQHHVGRAGAPPLMHHRVTRARRHLLL